MFKIENSWKFAKIQNNKHENEWSVKWKCQLNWMVFSANDDTLN